MADAWHLFSMYETLDSVPSNKTKRREKGGLWRDGNTSNAPNVHLLVDVGYNSFLPNAQARQIHRNKWQVRDTRSVGGRNGS